MEPINQRTILLASGSPRRKELLEMAGLKVRVQLPENPAEEIILPEWPVLDVAEHLAVLKGQAALHLRKSNEVLLTADSIVLNDHQILGKPQNRAEAMEMLLSMSNRMHQVITGVYMASEAGEIHFSETTEVEVGRISEAEAAFYIENYKPYDKAGGYGIQEWFGLCRIKKINGNYPNVVGLPVYRVYEELVFPSLKVES